VARGGDHAGAPTEVDGVAVAQLDVDRAGRNRRYAGADAVVDRLLGRREHGFGPAAQPAHDRRVGTVGVHPDTVAPRPQRRRGARVVLVPVGDHDAAQVRAAQAQLVECGGEGGLAARDAGVDERDAVVVAPEVGLAERGPHQVQPGTERHDLHT